MKSTPALPRGIWLSLGSVMLMAAWYPAMKIAVGEISPLQAASIEAISTAAAAWIWMHARHQTKRPPLKSKFGVFALLSTIALVLLYISLKHLGSVVVSLVGRLYVVICALLAVFFLQESLTKRSWALLIISALSTVAFLKYDTATISFWGLSASFGYVVCFAIANLLAKQSNDQVTPAATLFWSRCLGAIALPALGIALNGSSFLIVNPLAVIWVSGTSVLTMFAGLMLYYRALSMSSFAIVNSIRSLGPIFVFVYSQTLSPEPIRGMQVMAGMVCVLSVGMLSVSSRKAPTSKPKEATGV